MKKMRSLVVIAFAVFCLLTGVVSAYAGNTLNVPADYPTIKAAILAASWGDTVQVAPGEYVESIRLKPGVAVQSSGGPEATILRCDGSTTWTWGAWHTYTVVGADNSSISGFTITGAYFGFVNENCSPTVTNNIIADNTFAGMTNAVSSTRIINNIITRNHMGIHNWRTSTVISGNTVVGNTWAGIVTDWSTSRITDNIVIGNNWGIYNQWYSNPLLTNNTVSGNGVGIYNSHSCRPMITNNIITGNGTGVANMPRDNYTAGSFPTITYNNLWDNETDIYDDWRSHSTVADNIAADPMFTDTAAGNYRLKTSSPCIDAGTNGAPGLQETDFDGNPRIFDGDRDGLAVVDMGAFEFQQRCSQAPEIEVTSYSPEHIWPPNHRTVEIAVSGRIILPDGCTVLGARYGITDEYGEYSSEGALALDAEGNFTVSIPVEAWRNGRDEDGRRYSMTLYVEDEAGRSEAGPYDSVVPHDVRN